jgi:hypothetical protein
MRVVQSGDLSPSTDCVGPRVEAKLLKAECRHSWACLHGIPCVGTWTLVCEGRGRARSTQVCHACRELSAHLSSVGLQSRIPNEQILYLIDSDRARKGGRALRCDRSDILRDSPASAEVCHRRNGRPRPPDERVTQISSFASQWRTFPSPRLCSHRSSSQ